LGLCNSTSCTAPAHQYSAICEARRDLYPSREVVGARLHPLPHLNPRACQNDGSADWMHAVMHDVVPDGHGPPDVPRRARYFPAGTASAAARLRAAASSLPLGTSPFLTIFDLYQAIHPGVVEAAGWTAFTLAMIWS
jgi:hypothetical protein